MKKFILGFVLGAVIFSAAGVYAATQQAISVTYNNIKIAVNGTVLNPDTEPFVFNGRTMVPARFIAEALNKDIKYNEITDTVEITDKVTSTEAISSPSSLAPTTTETTQEMSTPDGIIGFPSIQPYDGIYYIPLMLILDKYQDSGLTVETYLDKSSNTTYYNLIKNGNVILENLKITRIKDSGRDFLEYNYYVNTVLPLIKN